MLHSHRRVSPISRFAANRDPDSRFPAKAGNGAFPDSRFRPNRESGIPSPIPGQIGNRGNGNWGFPGLLAVPPPPSAFPPDRPRGAIPQWHRIPTEAPGPAAALQEATANKSDHDAPAAIKVNTRRPSVHRELPVQPQSRCLAGLEVQS